MEFFTFSIIVLVISAVAHEMAHGYAADLLGDDTPRLQGRLTLNPLKHLDPIGSFLLPVLTYNIGGFLFGWAKPVEFNPNNLAHPRRDEMIIAAAGPLTNFMIALVFGLLVRFAGFFNLTETVTAFASIVVVVNLSLMIFNLMPIPPLDGSKIFLNLIPERFDYIRRVIIENGLIIFLIFILFATKFISPIIGALFKMLTGYNFL